MLHKLIKYNTDINVLGGVPDYPAMMRFVADTLGAHGEQEFAFRTENATKRFVAAIERSYNSAQTALGNAVDTISGKVDTINTHIDNVLKDAPTKLKVSVRVDEVDWKKIQDMFDKQHEWMTTQMQKHIREVNQMFYEERRRVQERYKEYNGTCLGHYVQYFFWFFFAVGLVIFGLAIFLMLDSHYHWTK